MPYPIITLFRSCYGLTRLWEFQAVATRETSHIKIDWQWDEQCHFNHGGDYGPSIIQSLSHDLSATQWANIGAQCIGNKAVFQVLGEGETLQDCVTNVGRLSDEEILQMIPNTWSLNIKHLGKMKGLSPNQSRAQMEEFQEVLSALDQRPVDLNNPESELWLLKDCRRLEDSKTSSKPPTVHYHWLLKRIKPTTRVSAQQLAAQSDIKKRAFISTTTMPADRALLMANLAQVQPNTTVLDPFCGSAGLLIASALLGAKTVGGDIDTELLSHQKYPLCYPASAGRPLRGTEAVSFTDSFTELGLDSPTLLLGANIKDSQAINLYLEANQKQTYDAIVTDPPYGIRESQSQMNSFELLARLGEVADALLKDQGRLVLLQLIDGRLEQADQVKKQFQVNIEKVLSPYQIQLEALSLERFNTRRLRATLVLVKRIQATTRKAKESK